MMIIVSVLAIAMTAIALSLNGITKFQAKQARDTKNDRFRKQMKGMVLEVIASLAAGNKAPIGRLAVAGQPTSWVLKRRTVNPTMGFIDGVTGTMTLTLCDPRKLNPAAIFPPRPSIPHPPPLPNEDQAPDQIPVDLPDFPLDAAGNYPAFDPATNPVSLNPKACPKYSVRVTFPKTSDWSDHADIKIMEVAAAVRAKVEAVVATIRTKFFPRAAAAPRRTNEPVLAVFGAPLLELAGRALSRVARADGDNGGGGGDRSRVPAAPPDPDCILEVASGKERVPVNTHTILELTTTEAVDRVILRNLSVLDSQGNPIVIDPDGNELQQGDGWEKPSPLHVWKKHKAITRRSHNAIPSPDGCTPVDLHMTSKPHVNVFEAEVHGPGGTKKCKTEAPPQVVLEPSCCIQAPQNRINFGETGVVNLTAVFTDTVSSDRNSVEYYRNGTLLQTAQPSAEVTTLADNVDRNTPLYDMNNYYAVVKGFGGTATCSNTANLFGVKPMCSLAWSPQSIYVSQSSTSTFTPEGPILKPWTQAYWNIDKATDQKNEPYVFTPANPPNPRTLTIPETDPTETIWASGRIYNGAGMNYCPSAALSVTRPETPSCALSYTPQHRLLVNKDTVRLRVDFRPAPDNTIVYRSAEWDPSPGLINGGPASPGQEIQVPTATTPRTDHYSVTITGYTGERVTCPMDLNWYCSIYAEDLQIWPPRDASQVIRRLYHALLAREWDYDVDGNFFLDEMGGGANATNVLTVDQVKQQIMASQEYQQAGGDARRIVTGYYRIFLGRVPDQAYGQPLTVRRACQPWNSGSDCEEAGWIAAVAQALGAPDKYERLKWVANAIANSPEAASRGHYHFKDAIEDIYKEFLGRDEDEGGAEMLIQAMLNYGWTILDAENAIAGSDEYYLRGGWIGKQHTTLYQVLLGRDPGIPEIQYWNYLRNIYPEVGLDRVAQYFRSSDEYRTIGGCVVPKPPPPQPGCPLMKWDADTGQLRTWPIPTPWSVSYEDDKLGTFPFGLAINLPAPDGVHRVVSNATPNIVAKNADKWVEGVHFDVALPQGARWVGCPPDSQCFEELTAYPLQGNYYLFAVMHDVVPGAAGANCGFRQLIYRPHGCFAPESKILRADGKYVEARTVRIGDMLWNPVRRSAARVRDVITAPEPIAMLEIGFGDSRVHVTTKHPFQTPAGPKQARYLKMTDEVLGADGKYHKLTVRRALPIEAGQQVWNFTLDSDSALPEDHMVLSDGIVTGDLFLQTRLEKGYTP